MLRLESVATQSACKRLKVTQRKTDMRLGFFLYFSQPHLKGSHTRPYVPHLAARESVPMSDGDGVGAEGESSGRGRLTWL